jgi:hypothetical protein
MPVSWPDEVDAVLAGDLTAALAYVTPAEGAVVTPVSPNGLRDREAGTVTFTTSLGLGKKLERIEKNANVALAYHAREHGFAGGTMYVLVQGKASANRNPDRDYLENVIAPEAERFVGPRKRGRLFWDRWLREYYSVRVPVLIQVERVVVWPDLRCDGEPAVYGAARAGPPPSQRPPGKGTAPRVDASRATRRLQRLEHTLVGFVGSDGLPAVSPVEVTGGGDEGVQVGAAEGLLPSGARRAGLLGHQYGPQLVGMTVRQFTGWLEVAHPDGRQGLYAPHTEQGFRAPTNKTLLMLANGFVAKRGVRRAERASAAGHSA